MKTKFNKVLELVMDYQWDSGQNVKEAENIAKKIHRLYTGLEPFSKFKKIHCLLSQEGLNSFGKQRYGYVVGESNDGRRWRVKWNGNKEPTAYAKDFIQLSK